MNKLLNVLAYLILGFTICIVVIAMVIMADNALALIAPFLFGVTLFWALNRLVQ